MDDDATVYRVTLTALRGDEQSRFADALKAVGAMIVYGTHPEHVTIAATPPAAAHIAELPFVQSVEDVIHGRSVPAPLPLRHSAR